ncbi:MAG TPA: hypothetical protein VGJ20_19215 [Xanthobacteraceae bacterium]
MQRGTGMDECDFAAFAHRLGLYATTSLKPGEILFAKAMKLSHFISSLAAL